MRAISIGIPFIRRRSGVPIDAQAQAHFNRVIADGGVVPSGLSGVNAFFSAVKAIYGTSDINTAISAAYDPHYLGYRLGAGSGTTLGQAARTLYAPKGIFGGIGTGSAYWEGVGVVGNNVTTPAIVSPTTQLDVVSYVYASAGHTNAATILSNDGANRNFVFNCSNVSSGILQLRAGTPFTNFNSTTGVGNFDNYTGWIRATYNQNGINGDVTFYTSTNSPNTPINSITWVQLGSVVSSASTGLQTGTHSIQLGSNQGSNNFTGRIGIAAFSTSIGGSPSVLFNANQYTGANTWTSTTGEVWTVNSTGAGLADVTQTTAASQPLLLAHTGENYWFGSGVANNFVSTPNAAANQITGDIEIIANFKLDSVSVDSALVAKDNVGSRFYNLIYIGTGVDAGKIYFGRNIGGSFGYSVSSVTSGFTTSTINWLKVNRSSSTGDVKFFTSTDGITYTQLGATITSTAGALTTGTMKVNVGALSNDTSNIIQGKIYRATISNSIGGTPVVDFNPSSYNPATSQTQWTSATGEVWTINTDNAASGYSGKLVNRTICAFGGAAQTSSFSTNTSIQVNQPDTIYTAFKFDVFNSYQGIFDSNTTTTRQQFNNGISSGNLEMNAGSSLIVTGLPQTTLKLATILYNGASSSLQINNGTATTGNAGTQRMDGLKLGTLNSNTFTLKGAINTLVVVAANDNSTRRTAMYNAIRGFNNNAF